jgi:hypothetical protein
MFKALRCLSNRFSQLIGPTGTIPEHLYIEDIIPVRHSPRKSNREEIRRMYLEEGLSASQIGERIELSKQAVLARLRGMGITRHVNQGRSAHNFRYPYASYGMRIVSGRLVTHAKEMKIARMIVHLRERSLSWAEISRHLNAKGLRSRRGHDWHGVRVRRVHNRWVGKI